jgi:glycosyltransferase involved in cell wall biosynthesis
MPTRILHVIARMNIGGTARYVGDLVENIPNSKLATGYVQGLEIEDAITKTLPVIRIKHMGRKISLLQDFLAWYELRKIIRQEEPQIVHTHTFKAGLIGRLIGGDQRRVHTFHGHLFGDPSLSNVEKKIVTYVEQFFARRTDFLISVGERVGVEIRTQGIGQSQHWSSIAPGVNPLPFHHRSSARKNLNLPESGLLVGWMARMASVKNPHLLLAVAAKVPEIEFVMAGGGELAQSILTLAPKNVRVIGWADASMFWSSVDLAISTSDNEGMPIGLIEAQFAGIPVVATNVGSISEVIEDGVTGIIVSKNFRELAEALQVLVNSSLLRSDMKRAAQKRAIEKFSLNKMISSHSLIYEELLNQ